MLIMQRSINFHFRKYKLNTKSIFAVLNEFNLMFLYCLFGVTESS